MTSPWESMLRQLEPDYDDLAQMLENGPKIKISLEKRNQLWKVRLEENWPKENYKEMISSDYENLDKRCKWAEEQLKTWKSATRFSHQDWLFNSRQEAEKFITLYKIVWAE